VACELEADRLKRDHEMEQVLGKALGAPALFPDASQVDDGSVCVGDHVLETLVDKAAKRIAELELG
jgi:hypothetical protein